MIDGRRVILATFAGRRDRMGLLRAYAKAALDAGLIDEWHVWDYARDPTDATWLEREFSLLRRLPPEGEYQRIGWLGQDGQGGAGFAFGARAPRDLLLRLRPVDPHFAGYEVVVGGWRNARAVLWRHPPFAGREAATEVMHREVRGVLSGQLFKTIGFRLDAGRLSVTVDGREILSGAATFGDGPVEVAACMGQGVEGELALPNPRGGREFRFGAHRDKRDSYNEFYNFYGNRMAEYGDAVFLKCDDDIIYFDLHRLQAFVEYRIRHPAILLLSANVINNGACALLQQELGLVPRSLMALDLPENAFGGALWESGAMAQTLHEYFLAAPARFTRHPYAQEAIAWGRRLSINFVAWAGADFSEMACEHYSDERSLSVELPARLGRTNAIHLGFVASHLSFGIQENGLDHVMLLQGYEELRRQALG